MRRSADHLRIVSRLADDLQHCFGERIEGLLRLGLRRLQPLNSINSELRPRPRSSFAKIATLESSLYMRNQLLRDTDWASMAHSLEVRVPLVDCVLLRAAAPLAASASEMTKVNLARSPKLPLPDMVIARQKTGFATPIASWQQSTARTQRFAKVSARGGTSSPWARRWACGVMAT